MNEHLWKEREGKIHARYMFLLQFLFFMALDKPLALLSLSIFNLQNGRKSVNLIGLLPKLMFRKHKSDSAIKKNTFISNSVCLTRAEEEEENTEATESG